MDLLLLAQDVTWGGRTGDAVHLRELARQLVRRGHAVRVVARGGSDSGRAAVDGVRFCPIRSSFNLAFVRAVADRRPDLVYSRSFGDVGEALAARALGLPIVFEVNGDFLAERESQLGRSLTVAGRGWAVRASRRGFRLARSVVAVTETLRRRLSEDFHVPPDRLRVVPNAADTDLFRPMPSDAARRTLGVPVGGPVVLFVGNLAGWQGVPFLLRAFAELVRTRPDAVLLIVGGGQADAELRALAADLGIHPHVRFVGPVVYEEVPRHIAAADVCTAPMTRERLRSGSSAIKVYEYLACGRPVVASRIPGLEFLESEDLGKLVPPEDAHALAAALEGVLSDAAWRRAAGERGRAFVLEHASWAAVAARVEDACRSAVAS